MYHVILVWCLFCFCRDFDSALVHFTSDTPEINEDNQFDTFVYVYLAYEAAMDVTGEETNCVVPQDGVKGQH